MIHSRLKNARLARGLSLDQLAQAIEQEGVSLSKAALSKYERGESCPAASLLPILARILSVDTHYFFEDARNKVVWGEFRKSAKMGKKNQQQLQAIASDSIQHLVWLEKALLVKPEPSLNRSNRRPADTVEAAELTADKVRSSLGLDEGPVLGLIELLERHGVIVLTIDHIEDSEFDGLSGWLDESRPLIVIKANAPTDRLRFSLAHELGHLMLECDHLPHGERELLAHRFASAFLVPSRAARAELGSSRRNLNLAELGLLKRKYGMSIQAWVRRAFDLGIITEGLYRKLFTELSAKGWRKLEPQKFDFPGVEETSHLKQYTLRALNEGLISAQRAHELCPSLESLDATSDFAQRFDSAALLRLTSDQRNRFLEAAANLAYSDYLSDSSLTDFLADDFLEY